jgi:anti-sigma B factor antagonist
MNSTNLTVRQTGDVAIVDLHGRLTQSEGSGAFQETIWKLVETGSTRILLNMADITTIDSCGIRELVDGYAGIARAGCKMNLLNVSEPVKTLLQTMGLCDAFETQEDEEWPVRSFSAYAITRFAPGSEYFLS